MVFDLFQHESVEISQCFEGVEAQSIGTSHGFRPQPAQKCEISQCFEGVGAQNIENSNGFRPRSPNVWGCGAPKHWDFAWFSDYGGAKVLRGFNV